MSMQPYFQSTFVRFSMCFQTPKNEYDNTFLILQVLHEMQFIFNEQTEFFLFESNKF
jgi:hypothetical protein